MQRRPSYYRRKSSKPSRPNNRVIQAGRVSVPFGGATATGYLFTATDPCTATNFKLDTGALVQLTDPIAYALVYVPSGYATNNLNYPTAPGVSNLYDPSHNVLISGVLSTNSDNEDHKSSRYSRKMNSGDRIALLYYSADPNSAVPVGWELSFTTLH